MREITVTYLISDEQEARLKKITEGYKKRGLDISEDKQFENIMCMGSAYDIEKKFEFHETSLKANGVL